MTVVVSDYRCSLLRMADPVAPVSLRLPPRAVDWMDEIAHENRITRSALMRCIINVARAHPDELEAKIGDLL